MSLIRQIRPLTEAEQKIRDLMNELNEEATRKWNACVDKHIEQALAAIVQAKADKKRSAEITINTDELSLPHPCPAEGTPEAKIVRDGQLNRVAHEVIDRLKNLGCNPLMGGSYKVTTVVVQW